MSVEGLSSVCSQELQETIVSNHEQSTKTFLSAHSLASKNLKTCVPFRSYFYSWMRMTTAISWGFGRDLLIFLPKCHRFITFTSSTEPWSKLQEIAKAWCPPQFKVWARTKGLTSVKQISKDWRARYCPLSSEWVWLVTLKAREPVVI